MTHLVADDGAQLAVRQDAADAGRHGHDRVVGVAARGKRVRRFVLHDEHARHRHLAKARDLGDHAVSSGLFAAILP